MANRPKYKEMYIREKGKKEVLEKQIDFYKQCLNYMNKKGIISYTNQVCMSEREFAYVDKHLVEVDGDFRLMFCKLLAIEDYDKEVK